MPKPKRYTIVEPSLENGHHHEVWDTTTSNRIASCYSTERARLVCDALNALADREAVNAYPALRAENARLREALRGIATSRHCETEGCNEDYPMCEVMEARAALTETEAK